MKLYEILVPCRWNDGVPIRTKHHREWDRQVRAVSGGLTIQKPAVGQWVDQGELYKERVIPVRIACSAEDIAKIASITIVHYQQLAVMYHLVSEEAEIVFATDAQKAKFIR